MVRKSLWVAVVMIAVLVTIIGSQAAIEPAKAVASTVKAGPLNSITDVPGILVGSYDKNFTGTTVIYAPDGAVGGVDIQNARGGIGVKVERSYESPSRP